MFREIMKIWREQAFFVRIVDEFLFMLDRSEEMLSFAVESLSKHSEKDDVQENIYNKDQSINLKERDIRKQVILHLSANPGCNISACLALFSIIKDAERVGDYIKNLFELKNLLGDLPNDQDLFKKLFEENGSELKTLFKDVAASFKNSDKELATKAVKNGRNISRKCEELIVEAIETGSSNREAVVVSLGARYMKRIALHLANISSSVINPITEIDYIKVESSDEE
ncbi:PhoU domain-containing protein [Candidatus Latescibacterota bacterium]